MKFSTFFAALLLVQVFTLVGCSDSTTNTLAHKHPSVESANIQSSTAHNPPQVGFFAPGGGKEDFASKVDIQLYNLHNLEGLKKNLQLASSQGMKLFLALGLPPMLVEDIATDYRVEGKVYKKQLAPSAAVKLRRTVSREKYAAYLAPFLEVMADYSDTLEAVFLSDEPYLNGVSFQDLDQMALDVRYLLDSVGLDKVKIGAVFASAMFNAGFAQHIDAASSAYARGIDDYFLTLKKRETQGKASAEELHWLAIIGDLRLTTYDKANNMYLGGGLPASLDLVGFDYYFSTLLQDGVHNESLQWFAQQQLHPACASFKKSRLTELRKALSFWDAEDKMTDNPALQAKQAAKDKALLDQWYTCRTESVFALLQQEIKQSERPNREVLLVSESSTNGVMAFDAGGNMLVDQQLHLSHQRVIDEVVRALEFVKRHPVDHLLFFTYEDQFDLSINLNIGGVSGIPEALHLIYQNAKRAQ